MSTPEVKLITKIIRELSMFLMLHGYEQFSIETDKEKTLTTFRVKVKKLDDKTKNTMLEKLNREREIEIETYGWQLVGDLDQKSELEIVGSLVDDAKIEEENGHHSIIITRKNPYLKKH